VVALQSKSSETHDTSEASGDLAGTSGRNDSGASGLGGGNGGVLVAAVADNGRGDLDGAGDGARAVGDGQGGGSSDGPGLGAVGDLGSLRAVGGVNIDNVGNVGNVLGGSDTGGSGENNGRELHFDGIKKVTKSRLSDKWCWLTSVIDTKSGINL